MLLVKYPILWINLQHTNGKWLQENYHRYFWHYFHSAHLKQIQGFGVLSQNLQLISEKCKKDFHLVNKFGMAIASWSWGLSSLICIKLGAEMQMVLCH